MANNKVSRFEDDISVREIENELVAEPPPEVVVEEPVELVTVAAGRTVHRSNGTRPRGIDDKGGIISVPIIEAFGPGSTLSLPRSEVKELRARGFLVDPTPVKRDKVTEGATIHPQQTEIEGASITSL